MGVFVEQWIATAAVEGLHRLSPVFKRLNADKPKHSQHGTTMERLIDLLLKILFTHATVD